MRDVSSKNANYYIIIIVTLLINRMLCASTCYSLSSEHTKVEDELSEEKSSKSEDVAFVMMYIYIYIYLLRDQIEFHWIQRLRTQLPHGINTMDKSPPLRPMCKNWKNAHV